MSELGEVPENIQENLPENAEESVEIPDEWQAAANLRPHHFFNGEVQNAIRGERKLTDPKSLFGRMSGRLTRMIGQKVDMPFLPQKMLGVPGGYYVDVGGITKDQADNFDRSKDAFLNDMKKLKDDDVIEFDIRPDGICKSCIVGDHCTAVNLRTWKTTTRDWDVKEKVQLEKIVKILENKGFSEGKEYIYKEGTTQLYDFGRKTLYQTGDPTPTERPFKSLLIKVVALRQII